MGVFADCISVDKVKNGELRGKLYLSYLVLDHLDPASARCDSDTKALFLPPISGIVKLNLYLCFQGSNVQVNTHSQVVTDLINKLKNCKLFEQLGFNYQVEIFKERKGTRVMDCVVNPIIIITLTDQIVGGRYVEELVNRKDEQMKLNKVEFKVISTLDIKIRVSYTSRDIIKEELLQDLNYLLMTFYLHLESNFPLIFKLTTRLIFQSTEATSAGLVAAFSKSKETEHIERRDILVGLIKSACSSLSFIDLLESYKHQKLKKLMEDKHKAIENKELLNLLWFK